MPVDLLLLLSIEDEKPILAEEAPLQRLSRPLVLRALRALPRVPRAQAPGLRHEHRVAGEYGDAGARGGHHSAAAAGRNEPLSVLFSEVVEEKTSARSVLLGI